MLTQTGVLTRMHFRRKSCQGENKAADCLLPINTVSWGSFILWPTQAYASHTRMYCSNRVNGCSDWFSDGVSHWVLREAWVHVQWSLTVW